MSTKNSNVQAPGRRTPLSLNAATKQTKSTNDKLNNQKETTAHNQKTVETLKKDSQIERKPSTDKRQPATDTKKSSSSDSKKTDETKTVAKSDDNKKNQNGVGVSTNGVNKSKEKSDSKEDGTSKSKGESSSTNGTPRKESQKSIEKKKDNSAEIVSGGDTKAVEIKKKIEEKTNEKEKVANADINKKVLDEKKKDKEKNEVPEKKKTEEEKSSEEKSVTTALEEKTKKEAEAKKGEEVPKLDKNTLVTKSLPEEKSTIDDVKTSATSVKDPQIVIEKPSEIIGEEAAVPSTQDPNESADIEMIDHLAFEDDISPQISASSTPAKPVTNNESSNFVDKSPKVSPKTERQRPSVPVMYTPDRNACPKTFSSISGRRSIRPMGDYTFNGKMRESYRKINTELDFTSSSLNVTVGSEVPNNDSFSFLSASRKRDRTLQSQHSVMDISPPKRARIEMSDFFTAVASPITKLRARFSRASVQSTPKKQFEEVPIVQDVVETPLSTVNDNEVTPIEDLTTDPDVTVGNTATEEVREVIEKNIASDDNQPAEKYDTPAIEGVEHADDIQIKETINTNDHQGKKRCSIM